MPKYRVYWTEGRNMSAEIEADSPEDAIDTIHLVDASVDETFFIDDSFVVENENGEVVEVVGEND